jgi:uncharacterized protein (TIGR00725 family)
LDEIHGINDRQIVSIFGSYAPQPGEPLYELAYAVGQALGGAGYVVCNGGYDGTMEASHKGAKDAGGATIGITCSVFSDYRGQPLKANRYCDDERCSENVLARIETMMRMSNAYVFLEGGTGTLCELGIVWEHVAKKLIDPRPIFVVGEFWAPMVRQLVEIRPKSGRWVHLVNDGAEITGILAKGIEPQIHADERR